MLDQLTTLETTVLTFGITTIILLGTTLYYIKQRKNNNNDNSSGVVEEETVKELDRSVSFMCFVGALTLHEFIYFELHTHSLFLILSTHNILYYQTLYRHIQEDT